ASSMPPAIAATSMAFREPNAPILEVTPVKSSNSVKVKWTKQDDGGSPIKHYLVRYKAVSILGTEVTRCHFAFLPFLHRLHEK
ncbi:hypothetical protein XENOCAPTIV_001454, partial [Xenoophorus captivus]